MLIAVLIYLVIGALIMGGIYFADPELISDSGFDDLFFTKSNIINCINGSIIFLVISMIWLPVSLAVIIKTITDEFN